MSKKKNKINTGLLSAVEIYKLVLSGKLKKFPAYFWVESDSVENANEIMRYLIEEVLHWTEEDVRRKYNLKILMRHNLGGLVEYCFNSSSFKALDSAYPGKYKPWDFKIPNGYWNVETGIETVKWLIEEKLQWNEEDIKNKLSKKVFEDNGLSGMVQVVFNRSEIRAINAAYPGKFKEWEFKNYKYIDWTKEKVIEAVKWLIESKLKWSEEEVKQKLVNKVFEQNGLLKLVELYDYSVARLVMEAYPNKYVLWDFRVQKGYWNVETGIEAVKWLIEEKLQWNEEDIKNKLSPKVFQDNGLSGMIQVVFNSSEIKAINAAYPGKFKEWEFKNYKYIDWTKEKAIEAVKWLIESKLKWSEEEVKEKLGYKVFEKNGLLKLAELYDYNVGKLAMEAYPNKYVQWDFRVPKGYWNMETGISATKWLVEEKLKLKEEDIKKKLSHKVFRDNGLRGMVHAVFNENLQEAIKAAYPHLYEE